jgi:2-methylcitrate dehydratase PrpD
VVSALVAGYELVPQLAAGAAQASTQRGFRATPVHGVVGAAAACARLLRLDADRCANAVAIAANFACGLVQCYVEGTHEAVVQVAQASRNGYVAALLAEQGFVLRHEWSLC